MIIKITRASKKDQQITIATNQFNNIYDTMEMTIKLDGKIYKATFHNSRNRKTVYSEDWEGPLPDVGKPRYGNLIKTEKIK